MSLSKTHPSSPCEPPRMPSGALALALAPTSSPAGSAECLNTWNLNTQDTWLKIEIVMTNDSRTFTSTATALHQAKKIEFENMLPRWCGCRERDRERDAPENSKARVWCDIVGPVDDQFLKGYDWKLEHPTLQISKKCLILIPDKFPKMRHPGFGIRRWLLPLRPRLPSPRAGRSASIWTHDTRNAELN